MSDANHCVLLGLTPSFGFGDRIGKATPGHIASMKAAGNGFAPIYVQQSIREMTRTGRTPHNVMDDGLKGVRECGWTTPHGADADHLKTEDDVRSTMEVGFTFFTIDPSDFVDRDADNDDENSLRRKYSTLKDDVTWFEAYTGKDIALPTGTHLKLTEEICLRAAVKYGLAINHTIKMGTFIKQEATRLGKPFEIELSVDETDHPTSLAEHYIIADQLQQHDVNVVSLAPRFVGDFEKGVDFKGDIAKFEASLKEHAAIAKLLGPYKLSLHSGSDKLSVYGPLAKATEGCFHVKTAGTSYLEAVRVAAHADQTLFKEIIDFSRERYETDRATYHVSATLKDAPTTADESDVKVLEKEYLGIWDQVPAGQGFTEPGRQVLHCTFGSVLTSDNFGKRLKDLVHAEQELYTKLLEEHFVKHLEALQAGMP